ncbi:MAG: pantoate--beta-alanine ligase [Planctomycetes bacterium]|nr:pantoate--beta-alanine ligase [Planctomycetota bacterium]
MFSAISRTLAALTQPSPVGYVAARMQIVHEPRSMAAFHGCALVPTMGALHDGHGSLIRRARLHGLPVVVTVFVNPTQFAPHEDFGKYPRTLDRDVALATQCGADAVFAPAAEDVYPAGPEASRQEAEAWPLPPVACEPGLEDACRPGHFGGVCQVVARLFDLCRPAVAVFGEKDWQQLRVITAMAEGLAGRWPGLRIEPASTVRDPDGLAMSSRNGYLRPEQREQALGLVRALQMAASAQRPATAEALMRSTLEAHGLAVDYAVVRDARTLLPVQGFERPTRGLIAARLDTVRLIDNMALPICR